MKVLRKNFTEDSEGAAYAMVLPSGLNVRLSASSPTVHAAAGLLMNPKTIEPSWSATKQSRSAARAKGPTRCAVSASTTYGATASPPASSGMRTHFERCSCLPLFFVQRARMAEPSAAHVGPYTAPPPGAKTVVIVRAGRSITTTASLVKGRPAASAEASVA